MAAHFLTLTDGSEHLLPSIFPGVDHVGRFNLTSEAAREVLVNADVHLGTMAVPYALAIHEDLMRSCIRLTGNDPPYSTAGLHEKLQELCGAEHFHADSLAQCHTLREMRNAVIHSAGLLADDRVPARAAAMSEAANTEWKKLAGRSPTRLRVGDTIDFGTGELFLALAVTKSLGRQANNLLARTLPKSRWAQVIVEDFLAHAKAPRVGSPEQIRKKLLGWARFHYQPAQVPADDVLNEGREQGLRLP